MDDTAHRTATPDLTPSNQPGPYDGAAEARWVPEPDKRPGRTAFQRDRARVLHSAALRRLAGTTQVVAPMRSDFPRTRLTHSLECAQVGRELGAALGCDPDLVEAGCLAHDIGHPPFGHTGEEALDQAAEACGGFEGNAQSLRILTRLEPKRFAPLDEEPARLAPWPGRSVGLNLSRAALDAATKYPWTRGAHPTDPGSTKYGVYADDLPVFRWLRAGSPPDRKCFEATVMDWSDDVAYSTHDVEDGLQAGHIDPEALRSPVERAELFKVAERYAPDAPPEELSEALDRLHAQPWWPAAYDGSARARAGLKDLTSQLIGRFCLAAEQATRARYGPGRLTRYAAELVVPREVRLECAVLKAVAVRYVMQRDEQEQLRSRQRIVIAELAEVLTRRAPEGLDVVFAARYEEAEDDCAALRAVIDQIATLTDASALALHARLLGPAART
ncbi:deoxyguanosinetriphosphate triphosphohydrolase [Kitasatospora sp. NBC_00240]|uniref:deoxyguanosinetriphosphate triphosphohydrolase n=1 Tax=Kitasatospora sp. NBC_00240 TaxID=2903567 RepID=UPI00225767FE|nr:deoxyguanosinetriphosphate triphosphohydrolase [Kitasatospora sp. NBC_00240]MCX5213080.1 deoxyguanosinetriphosphate triphosphohydrolase [Kitasatospora sp. NBC_00240]